MFRPNFESEGRSMVSSSMSQAKSRLMQRPTFRVTLLYILITLVTFMLTGLLGHALVRYMLPETIDMPFTNYLIILAVVLLWGVVHVNAMRANMTWIAPDDYLQGTIMTLLMGILGGIGIYLLSFSPQLFGITNTQGFKENVRPLVSTALIFPLPYFIQWAYESFDQIPPRIYKLWQYDPLRQRPHVPEHEQKQVTIVYFVVDIRYGERNHHTFNGFIPPRLTVGSAFQFGVEDTNQENPARQIEFRDDMGRFYQWYFYIKKRWWQPDAFIDPDRYCLENRLRGGERIIAKRLAIR